VIGVVTVLVTGGDLINSLPDHLNDSVMGMPRRPKVVDPIFHGTDDAEAFIHLPKHEYGPHQR
jgi:hypothetical protein